jgi:hypothetical protein
MESSGGTSAEIRACEIRLLGGGNRFPAKHLDFEGAARGTVNLHASI